MRIRLFFILILLVTAIAHAQAAFPTDAQRILLPIRPLYVAGTYGSAWYTEVGFANLSDSPLPIYGVPPCATEGCPQTLELAPHSTSWAGLIGGQCSSQGMLLAVDRNRAADIALTERTHDTSRDAKAWGVMVPTVRDDQMPPLRFSLVDVPMDARFRVMLRIYDIDPATPPSVRVRVYAENYPSGGGHADTLLTEFVPSFAISNQPFCVDSVEIPISNDPLINSAPRVRIEIESLDGRRDYWAFASVTNNDTQEVSTVSPQ